MFDYLIIFYNYFKLFLGISLFSYIYKICFDSCNQKVNIKTKHNKTKQTIKSKIGLSLLYLFLIILLYYTLTLRVILTLLCTSALGIVYALDKFDPESLEIFCVYDKNKAIRYGWKIIYSGISVLFIGLTPVHNYISEHLNKTYSDIKNKTTQKFKEGLMGGIINNEEDDGFNIKKMIRELTSEVGKKIEGSSTSAMSDYLMRGNAKIVRDKVSMSSVNIVEETETDIQEENIIINQKDNQVKDEIKIAEDVKIVEEVKNKIEEIDMSIENKDIKPEEESEKVLEMMKKMTEIFSHEKDESTIQDEFTTIENSIVEDKVN